MKIDDSGLVLDTGFQDATAIVKDAFANCGFAVTTTETGHQRNAARPEQPRRYLYLRAVLPDLSFSGTEVSSSPMLGCTLSVIELNGTSSLVAADTPLAAYPLLSRLVPRVTHRIKDAFAQLSARPF